MRLFYDRTQTSQVSANDKSAEQWIVLLRV